MKNKLKLVIVSTDAGISQLRNCRCDFNPLQGYTRYCFSNKTGSILVDVEINNIDEENGVIEGMDTTGNGPIRIELYM